MIKYVLDFDSFFAGDIGGTMGLFLGASFLSVLEIVDFIIHRGIARGRTA